MHTLRKHVDEHLWKLNKARSDVESLNSSLTLMEDQLRDITEAQSIIQIASELTQKQLQYRISEIVTLALASIFPDPYTFKAEFSQRRNNVECDLFFERKGELIKPLDDAGGGASDVASLALRFSVWKDSGTRPVIFFDEALRNLSDTYKKAAGNMLKMLADKLKVQIIMVSHIQELQDAADKVFLVACKNDKATVSVV